MAGGSKGDATAGDEEVQPQAFDFKALGSGISKAGQMYAQGAAPQSESMRNYQSGSGSPWLGGGQSMSADSPVSYQIPQTPPNQVSDFQKQYYDIVGKIYQSYQQRVQNEGFQPQGGQFNF
jgi:hypothetical protein